MYVYTFVFQCPGPYLVGVGGHARAHGEPTQGGVGDLQRDSEGVAPGDEVIGHLAHGHQGLGPGRSRK